MGKRREGETEEERKERKRLKREHKKMVKKEFSEQHGFAWGKKIDEQLEAGMTAEQLLDQKESHSRAIQNDLELLAERKVQREREKKEAEADKALLQASLDAEAIKEQAVKDDVFFLHQALRRASIRIKDSRAKPIDVLAMNLAIAQNREEELKEQIDGFDTLGLEMDITEPYKITQNLTGKQLAELTKDIKLYTTLERDPKTLEFWNAMALIVQYECTPPSESMGKNISAAVLENINKMLQEKSLSQLLALEAQVNKKLTAGGALDVDYWETLLEALKIWEAKARVREMHTFMLDKRAAMLKASGVTPTTAPRVSSMFTEAKDRLEILPGIFMDRIDSGPLAPIAPYDPSQSPIITREIVRDEAGKLFVVKEMQDFSDMLELRRYVMKMRRKRETGSKHHVSKSFQAAHAAASAGFRGKASQSAGTALDLERLNKNPPREKHRFTAAKDRVVEKDPTAALDLPAYPQARFAPVAEVQAVALESSADLAAMIAEAKRGMEEDDNAFGEDEEAVYLWQDKFKPRKPRYFNTVNAGYEWNKYNSTHYDSDNPPPKQVQGYKFNIFYPDLIDKSVAPTYVIEEEEETKKAVDAALASGLRRPPPAETVLIRFKAGAPYEDIAFRIVNKEWEYGYKRGFVCVFDRGILKLHFKFKRIFYRRG